MAQNQYYFTTTGGQTYTYGSASARSGAMMQYQQQYQQNRLARYRAALKAQQQKRREAAYQDVLKRFQAAQDEARKMNEQRYAEAQQLYGQVISQYEPGGGFGAGYEAQLERTKQKTMAEQQQQLISSGLYGTSITAGLGQKFEEEVGQPARLKLEDLRKSKYAQALQAKAGLVERREDIGPDYSTIAQLAQQAYSY